MKATTPDWDSGVMSKHQFRMSGSHFNSAKVNIVRIKYGGGGVLYELITDYHSQIIKLNYRHKCRLCDNRGNTGKF